MTPEIPHRGEIWINREDRRECRVMCDPVEGYVMARYKGCAAWIEHINYWGKRFKRVRQRGAEAVKASKRARAASTSS